MIVSYCRRREALYTQLPFLMWEVHPIDDAFRINPEYLHSELLNLNPECLHSEFLNLNPETCTSI